MEADLHFEQMSSSWWDPHGPVKALHAINASRLQFINDNTVTPLQNKVILDVGCGGGILSESLYKQNAIVTGIDISDKLIEVAKSHGKQHKNEKLQYYCADILTLSLEQHNTFDIITCMEVCEHIDNPSAIFAKCKQLLKPNGSLFISTLNKNFYSYLLGIVVAEYVLDLVPPGTHQYEKFIKPSTMRKLLAENGMKIQAIQGIIYNPISNSSYLSNDVSINYIIHVQNTSY